METVLKEEAATFCPTKAGKGFKIVIAGTWFYTSKYELFKVLNGNADACIFRTIQQEAKE